MHHHLKHSPLLLLVLAFVNSSAVLGVPQNVTCDDQVGCNVPNAGAIIDFIPSNGWAQGSTCTGCAVHANKSQAYNHTWHDTTLDVDKIEQRLFNITFHGACSSFIIGVLMLICFLGTAVYTFFIVPDNVSDFAHGVTILANMSVFLDNEIVGNILHTPQNQTNFIYNFPGYANTSLSNDSHVLSVSANNQVASSLILFDYFVYTYVFVLPCLIVSPYNNLVELTRVFLIHKLH